MLEFILDFVFDIILEGTIVIISEKKVPMPIRVIAGIIVALLYLGVSGLCFFVGVLSWGDREVVAALLFLVLGLFILIGGFIQMRKEIKRRNN